MTTPTASDDAPDPRRFEVGDRVIVSRAGEAPGGRGVLIEDYARWVDRMNLRADWPPVRRWAVSLDVGDLIFVDDEQISADNDNDNDTDTDTDTEAEPLPVADPHPDSDRSSRNGAPGGEIDAGVPRGLRTQR